MVRGGIGKTRLAVEYALRNAGTYSALLFVLADSPEGLRRNLAALCGPLVLNLDERDAAEEDVRVNASLRWLKENRGWLLILDNVDTPEAAGTAEEVLCELNRGHLLITSRLTDWSSAVTPIEVDVLNEDAATEFLLERTGQRRRRTATDSQDARDLALEQAGAYICHKRCALSDYHSRWREQDSAVRGWFDERLMKYPHSVATTWLTTMEQLTPAATDLLRTLSWFAPEPIPRTLLPTADLQDALAELASYSLVKLAAS